jgi:hypothetical protein
MTEATGASVADPGEVVESRVGVAVSVIVPVTERPQNLVDLYSEFAAPLRESGRSYEFVFVAEPWFHALTAPLAELASSREPISVYEAAQTVGEAALLKAGAARARGEILVTLPAYRRVTASALPMLVERVEGGVDVAVARRWPRRDSWINRLQNHVFHALLRRLVGGGVHDVACGVRAMRREVLEDLPLYGDFFRFVPLLALREGFRVEELAVPQHQFDSRTRLYGPGVYLRRLIDVLGLFFLLRFTHKPLRFFGLLGSTTAIGGFAVLGVLLVQRMGGQGIANRPLLLLGVLLVVLGGQAIALGLVGEIIVHLLASRRSAYRVFDAGLGQS